MAQSKKPLSEKVLEWLNKHGYPLEMTVAKALVDAGLYVDQSVYYRDPETDVPREIDVVAGWDEGEFADYFMFSVRFCIECKKSKLPWVVFSSPDKHAGSVFRQIWICSTIGQDVKKNLPPQATYQHPFHTWDGNWGTGVTTALREQNDVSSSSDAPYKAMMGATKAAYAIAQQADFKKWEDGDSRVLFGAMTQPVVVLDGTLFEAVLGESGDIEVNRVDEAMVSFRYPFSKVLTNDQDGNAVRIVTLPTLRDFAKRAAAIETAIIGCREAQEKAYEKHHNPRRSVSK